MTASKPKASQQTETDSISPAAATVSVPDVDFGGNKELAYLESVVKDWRARKGNGEGMPNAAPGPDAPERNGEPTPAPKAKSKKSDKPETKPAKVRPMMVVKSCIALAVAIGLGWVPVQRLVATTSAEATVNARLIILRAPIDGEVSMAVDGADIGTKFKAGQDILTIANARADATRASDLRRERGQTLTTIGALEAKRGVLLGELADLAAQQERFRVGRIAQLQQRVRETDNDIIGADAQLSVASAALSRAKSLRDFGASSQAALDKAAGDESVARAGVQGLRERRKGTLVELESAMNGTYIGDSYNDTPQSAQRKMDVELQLADVRARLAGSTEELRSIETDLADEMNRQKKRSTAVLRSTVNGRVWELLTAPGEHVNVGQDLMKLLDCGSAVVTASVSETAFQRLAIGQRATFRPRDGGDILEGRIVGLNGLSAVDSNSAIVQGTLAREPYHVTLKFPELARAGDCQIGRTGLVQFDTSTPPTLATTP